MAKNTTNPNDNKENLASDVELNIKDAALKEQDTLDINAQLIDEIEAIQDLIEKDDALIDDIETAAGEAGGGRSEAISFLRDAKETLASSEFQTQGFLQGGITPTFDENRTGSLTQTGPLLSSDNGVLDEDSGSITVAFKATDLDGVIVSTAASVPSEQGFVIINDDGTYTFTPALDFNGDATITLTTTDNDGLTATTTSTVTVNDINDGPAITADNGAMDEDTSSINVAFDASDTDVVIVSTVASVAREQGTVVVNNDGTYTFTPAENFNGNATITLTTTDNDGGTATTTSTVTVNDINDGPVITANNGSLDEDSGSVTVAFDASDVDGTIVE
ncbi:hypothetical protein JI57_01160, partial [Psychromonas sp. PRT-SC03]